MFVIAGATVQWIYDVKLPLAIVAVFGGLEFLAGCTLSLLADLTHAEPDLRALTRFIMRLGAAVLAFSLLVLFVLPRLSDF